MFVRRRVDVPRWMRLRVVKHLRLPHTSSTAAPLTGGRVTRRGMYGTRVAHFGTPFAVRLATERGASAREAPSRPRLVPHTTATLMHPISASPKSVKAPPEDALPLEAFFPPAEKTLAPRNSQRLPIGEAEADEKEKEETRSTGRGWRVEGNDLSPSGAKILPRVLVPPVEHPDGNRAARGGGRGPLRSSYRRVYNFRWVCS